MIPGNLCATCGEDFGSVELFDRHRVGDFGPGDYHGALEDWASELGRRCLTVAEMESKGWCLGKRGRWMDPARARVVTEPVTPTSLTPSEGPTLEAA